MLLSLCLQIDGMTALHDDDNSNKHFVSIVPFRYFRSGHVSLTNVCFNSLKASLIGTKRNQTANVTSSRKT